MLSRERGLQCFDIVKTLTFGEIVGELHFLGLGDLLDLHVEDRVLACEVLGTIFCWKCHLDLDIVINLLADQLVFEAGNERAGTEHKRKIVGRAALKRLVANLTNEVDGQTIAVLALPGFGGWLIFLKALGKVP